MQIRLLALRNSRLPLRFALAWLISMDFFMSTLKRSKKGNKMAAGLKIPPTAPRGRGGPGPSPLSNMAAPGAASPAGENGRRLPGTASFRRPPLSWRAGPPRHAHAGSRRREGRRCPPVPLGRGCADEPLLQPPAGAAFSLKSQAQVA